ncbi:MAG: hypothetical protein JW765_03950 [Deltaproteobacteria bacterium]|nr:hypothetical protein [Candidatus Zymogenaceae bacterium]
MKKISPGEAIIGTNNLTIGDFWSWAYSDVLSNINRSVFAEFIVGTCLGVIDKPRVEWDAYDLRYGDKNIEVKASAYIQSWNHESSSQIRFDISKKIPWYAETNTYEKEPRRSADCYVFCLYKGRDPNKESMLNLGNWVFYVIATARIDRELGAQKSVGLSTIETMSDPASHEVLKARIDETLTTQS